MQRLNGREWYVVVLMAITAIVFSILVTKELFGETSPFISNAEGEFVNMSKSYIINLGQSFLQLTLSIIGFVFLLLKRRAGWIASFSLLTLYTFLLTSALISPISAGIFDGLVLLGLCCCISFLTALIFLIIPSTLKKFNITKSAIIPVVCILLLLGTIAYLSTE